MTLVVGGVIALAGLYVYHYTSRRVEMIRFRLRRVAAAVFLFCVGRIILPHYYPADTVLIGSILMSFGALILVRPPKYSRYIPKDIKRQVIERDLPEGEAYDSSRVHFDHTVPYSRGGDTSVRNLKLRPKRDNLRKGAKRPKLRDFLD